MSDVHGASDVANAPWRSSSLDPAAAPGAAGERATVDDPEAMHVRYLPEAVVFLDTPLFKGEVRAHCLRDSLYDVVLGNIKGAVPLDTSRVMATQTTNPSSSADIEEKTPKTPTNRRSRRHDQVTEFIRLHIHNSESP
ncbi:hypothetical protein HPB52_017081 [Rhipicephalus sanguineus]|uniref:Uncharacterized protein n=1 Tax=Rhipicephalus sanguineus TaxID=34632 RepID=A0A9D4PJ71_RHISA|nr:hypothetical protein HPB52_017081 [Rhipicephalus sanguineus]